MAQGAPQSAPVISSLSDPQITAGSVIAVSGTNLAAPEGQGTTQVFLDGQALNVVGVSPSMVAFQTPATPTSGLITVSVNGVTSSTSLPLNVVAQTPGTLQFVYYDQCTSNQGEPVLSRNEFMMDNTYITPTMPGLFTWTSDNGPLCGYAPQYGWTGSFLSGTIYVELLDGDVAYDVISQDTLNTEAYLIASTIINRANSRGTSWGSEVSRPKQYMGYSRNGQHLKEALASDDGSQVCKQLERALDALKKAVASPEPGLKDFRAVLQGRGKHAFVRQRGTAKRVAGTDFIY